MQIQRYNEIDLIRQTLAGDTTAFDRLVKAHRTTVYALALSYTKNPADAEDLTQRIFIRAYEQLATLRELDRFLPWLQRITHNTCKDWLRRQSDSTTNFEAVNDADFAETAPSPEEIALKREVEAVVREAISALQETDRKLVEGRYIEGASYDQLQAESGLSYAAIANRLKRAKQQLRRRIERLLGGMAIVPGRTLIWGGIETVKLSVKTKLAMVGVVAVLGIGGGVLYQHTFESNSVVVNEQGDSEPEAVTEEDSTEIEKASSSESITAEEREQLDKRQTSEASPSPTSSDTHLTDAHLDAGDAEGIDEHGEASSDTHDVEDSGTNPKISAEELRRRKLTDRVIEIQKQIGAMAGADGRIPLEDSQKVAELVEENLRIAHELGTLTVEGGGDLSSALGSLEIIKFETSHRTEDGRLPIAAGKKIAESWEELGKFDIANGIRKAIQNAVESGDEFIGPKHYESLQ